MNPPERTGNERGREMKRETDSDGETEERERRWISLGWMWYSYRPQRALQHKAAPSTLQHKPEENILDQIRNKSI